MDELKCIDYVTLYLCDCTIDPSHDFQTVLLDSGIRYNVLYYPHPSQDPALENLSANRFTTEHKMMDVTFPCVTWLEHYNGVAYGHDYNTTTWATHTSTSVYSVINIALDVDQLTTSTLIVNRDLIKSNG
jgi:hypothetical protein